jgi:hypothetical protein
VRILRLLRAEFDIACVLVASGDCLEDLGGRRRQEPEESGSGSMLLTLSQVATAAQIGGAVRRTPDRCCVQRRSGLQGGPR